MILLQINFGFPVEAMGDALTQGAQELAKSINNEEGFVSKVWIENKETKESGGIYIFETMETAKAYATMHAERVKKMGATNITVKYFNINTPLSTINKGI